MTPSLFVVIVAVLATGLFNNVTAVAEESKRPRLYTNQAYIEDVTRPASLPLDEPKQIFAFVMESLPERVRVYPTENYYYFYFYDGGVRYAGNIRLDASDRDKGKLHFAYYADNFEWTLGYPDTMRYLHLGQEEGVLIEQLEPFVYRVSYDGNSVIFELNDLSGVRPPESALAPGDRYLGPVFDEAGIRFFLLFNERLNIFHYILDETVPVADDLFPSEHVDRILIGRRTGFAFYRDHHHDRKILIGVFGTNAEVNNYYDGPFDQLPDNFIVGDELRQAILKAEPELADEIDRFGGSPDGESRYMIAPYRHYWIEEDLALFHQCATDSNTPREKYHLCFAVKEMHTDGEPGTPPPGMTPKKQ